MFQKVHMDHSRHLSIGVDPVRVRSPDPHNDNWLRVLYVLDHHNNLSTLQNL